MLDQMMVTAADQSTKSYQLLEAVSQNMANVNTYGYKAVRFDQYMRPDGNTDLTTRGDFSQGQAFMTRRELDVALDGPGFIQVTRPDGSMAYTRNGSLAKNAEGYLVTPFGDMVGNGIQIPANYRALKITPQGEVQILTDGSSEFSTLGKITVANFANPEGLKKVGNNLFASTEESGGALPIENHKMLKQGHLEQSNVNIHYAVADILKLNAGVIANLRVIKAVDEVYREAVQLRQ